jgi:hypothetical protein
VENRNILGTQWKKLHTNQTTLVPLANWLLLIWNVSHTKKKPWWRLF